MFNEFVSFVKSIYPDQVPVPLHAPVFLGNEKEYLSDCITTTFVSYVGKYVERFEEQMQEFTGAKYAVATVNGTVALQIALMIAGVQSEDEVITQPLTFVATANAIRHSGAVPAFVDVDMETMGMCPVSLSSFLENNLVKRGSIWVNKTNNRKVSAIVPMHTFGIPCKIAEILKIAELYGIPVIEDAAESLGSFTQRKHTGTFGIAGILSFNGNKTVTTGGGGIILTDDESFAKKARHLTTTGKVPHRWEFNHDTVAYNFRMTNLNAAVGVAQMEYIDKILENKRETNVLYTRFFQKYGYRVFSDTSGELVNYWLNALVMHDQHERDRFLDYSNNNQVSTRPIWRLMNKLPMYHDCSSEKLPNSEWFEDRIVNLPSGFRK